MNFNSKTSGFYAFLQKVTIRKAIYLEPVTNFRLRCHGICDFANRPLEKNKTWNNGQNREYAYG